MNRNLFIPVAGICFMICGCAGFDEDIPVASGTIPVNIDGGISMTRASADGFADGDAVGIYVVNYTDGNASQGTLLDNGNQADHVRYVYSASERSWTPSQNVYYKDDKTNVDIYGYYPYSKPESVSAYPFEVEKDQSVPAEGSGLSGYEASDFLWGSAIGIAPNTDKVKITFRHRMACANVILAEGTGFEEGEFDLLDKSVMVMNTTRQATIDISTGTVTPVGEASAEGTVMKKCDEGFRAIAPDGLEEQDADRQYLVVKKPIHYKDDKTGSEITVLPAEEFSVDLTIDFNSHVLGVQKFHYDNSVDFATEIAPCRTFVFFHELEFLFKNNLIKGGDLENALVIVEHPVPEEDLARMAALFNVDKVDRLPEGYLDNVRLHFPDECARHKLLDLIGDFSLVGRHIKGHVIADKSGHRINTAVARIMREEILRNENN